MYAAEAKCHKVGVSRFFGYTHLKNVEHVVRVPTIGSVLQEFRNTLRHNNNRTWNVIILYQQHGSRSGCALIRMFLVGELRHHLARELLLCYHHLVLQAREHSEPIARERSKLSNMMMMISLEALVKLKKS